VAEHLKNTQIASIEIITHEKQWKQPVMAQNITHEKQWEQPVMVQNITHEKQRKQHVMVQNITHEKQWKQPVMVQNTTHEKQWKQPVMVQNITHEKQRKQPVMVQNNGYINFNAYLIKVDVIKHLRYIKKTSNVRINVKFRRVRATVVVAVGKQRSECVCSLTYPA